MAEEFNRLVNSFKELETEDKMNAIIELLKTDVAVAQKLNSDIQNEHELLLNREILDVSKNDKTLDDFLEAVYVYIHTLNDQYISFAEKISNEFYE